MRRSDVVLFAALVQRKMVAEKRTTDEGSAREQLLRLSFRSPGHRGQQRQGGGREGVVPTVAG